MTDLLGREPRARRDSFFSWLLGDDEDEDEYEDSVISMFTDGQPVE